MWNIQCLIKFHTHAGVYFSYTFGMSNKFCNWIVFACIQCPFLFVFYLYCNTSLSLSQQDTIMLAYGPVNIMINSLRLNIVFLLWDQFCKDPFHSPTFTIRQRSKYSKSMILILKLILMKFEYSILELKNIQSPLHPYTYTNLMCYFYSHP